jgi:hypothetical protein
MNASVQLQSAVLMNRHGVVRRRDFLRTVGVCGMAAGGACGTLGWTDLLSLKAAELRSRGMACIVLWMQGGPSQFETFSPKPGHANGGPTQAIHTSVAGIQISENLPRVAAIRAQLICCTPGTCRRPALNIRRWGHTSHRIWAI